MPTFHCRHCGTPVGRDEPIPRDAECTGCGRDLRACVQCRHYDPAYHNACRETEADPVSEKERRNFCEFFSFDPAPLRPQGTGREAEARARLEGLFGGKPGTETGRDRTSDARRRLDALFRKPDPESK